VIDPENSIGYGGINLENREYKSDHYPPGHCGGGGVEYLIFKVNNNAK
jgi:hypothetical protein